MTMNNHVHNGGTPATCWEILTVRLGRFAKETSDKGVLLTDELLQNQARVILYDDPDPWNQTAADNPEWLDLFKRAHGLDYIPSTVGGRGKNVPEDLEMYGDLGVRIPFSVQLKHDKREEQPSGVEGLLKQARERNEAASQQQSLWNCMGKPLESAPPRKHQRYSALAVPSERVQQFETVTAPYPESGVRGEVLYTQSMHTESESKNHEQADMLCFLGLTGPAITDLSTPTTRTNSTGDVFGLQQSEEMSDSTLSNLGYHDSDNILSGLGVGSGKLDGMPNEFGHSAQDHSSAQADLFALNASLAAATTSSITANTAAGTTTRNCSPSSSCCKTGKCSADQGQVLMHLGFAPDTLDLGSHGEGLSNSTTNPGSSHTSAHAASMEAVPAPPPTPSMQQSVDVNMTDFDFNDLSFNDIQFGDMDFSLFDSTNTSMDQFDSCF
jgi:hypothetical protein